MIETPDAAVAAVPQPDSVAVPEAAPASTIVASHPPRVVLSEAHDKTCVLKVGDQMPSSTLTDIAGTPQQLERLYGPKLTVVLFWNSQIAAAMEQFQRLGEEVWGPWSKAGVAVLAINEGDSVARVRDLTGDAKASISSLVDVDGAVFGQVATQILPRTYLLDSKGKILWFDLEYSQSTRRELQNAVAYYLRP